LILSNCSHFYFDHFKNIGMANTIADLFSKIESDPWRQEIGFSNELSEAHKLLQEAGNTEEKIIAILTKWLQKHQPCLFGRLAARLNMLSFCVLTEDDLNCSDKDIRDKIQDARTKWTAEGFEGKKSGFILFVASQKLSCSIPNKTLMLLSQKLCSLYLLDEIEEDKIYMDEIWLEKPGPDQITWKWHAGVNYFCANADRRWWQDHRFPGGLAFSVNSVGHMAKACGIAKIMNEMNSMLEIRGETFIESPIDSLGQALEFAMRTIDKASDSVSGKATELIPVDESHSCPIKLPPNLIGKDCSIYKGYYHTDITIPSEYFTSDIERPKNSEVHTLDFTYLHDKDVSNPAFITMGEGRKIRSTGKRLKAKKDIQSESQKKLNEKLTKSYSIEEKIAPESRLYNAIRASKS
jgi:hypothetical protein